MILSRLYKIDVNFILLVSSFNFCVKTFIEICIFNIYITGKTNNSNMNSSNLPQGNFAHYYQSSENGLHLNIC